MLERKKTGFSLILKETGISDLFVSLPKLGTTRKWIPGTEENGCLFIGKRQGERGVLHVTLYVL